MASITSWVRLEPRARDADLLAGAEARLHDPLWLLARQWQLRELAGFDGGSTISATARVLSSRLDALGVTSQSWQPFSSDATPLEVALAAAPDDAQPALASRVRTGRQLLRMLALEHVATAPFLAKFPLSVASEQLLDDDDRRLLAVMTGRVPDGDLAAATLAPLVGSGDLPASFGVAPDQIARASAVVRAWLTWRGALASTAPGTTWRPESNAYRFAARASGELGTIELAFQHAENRPVRWYDATASTATAPGEGKDVVAMPSRVRYRGMPARRYWDLEDGAVHWPSVDAGPGDIGRVMLVEIALTLADHWLMIPIELAAGSIARVDSLVATDTFGEPSTVRSAAELDGDASPWRFCELTRAPGIPGPLLLVPPAASEPIVGRPLEAVDLSRDEVSNVLWAIERTRAGADGRPREVPPPAPPAAIPSSPDAPPLVYRVGPEVPDGYHPYVPHTGAAGIELARASVPGGIGGRVALPDRFTPAAVPARPHQLRRVDELVRTSDGAYHWIRRRVLVATAPRPSVTLQFDQIVDREVPR